MGTDQKVSVVVGGAGSIGSAIAEGLADKGHHVTVVSRRKEHLQLVSEKLGSRIATYAADFSSESDVVECLRHVRESHGRLDYIVHSAGLVPDTDIPLAEYPLEAWNLTFGVYVTGFFLCFREAMKLLQPGGHVVAISSAITRIPGDRLPPFYAGHYSASKAALDEFCKWARREAHERGILLSRLAPGAVDTPFHQNSPPNRRPPAMLPLPVVVGKIVNAIESATEIDEQLVATPPR